jgi:hypothetical protein
VDHATEAGCATLQLEGDNDEKSCRDADSLTRCCRGKGHGHLGGGDGGGGSSVIGVGGAALNGGGGAAVGEVIQPGDGKGPAVRRRWGRASGRGEREREVMGKEEMS